MRIEGLTQRIVTCHPVAIEHLQEQTLRCLHAAGKVLQGWDRAQQFLRQRFDGAVDIIRHTQHVARESGDRIFLELLLVAIQALAAGCHLREQEQVPLLEGFVLGLQVLQRGGGIGSVWRFHAVRHGWPGATVSGFFPHFPHYGPYLQAGAAATAQAPKIGEDPAL